LKWDENRIDFELIRLLFAKTLNDGLTLCDFLTRQHIDQTNFEKIKVSYARDIKARGSSYLAIQAGTFPKWL
jgi:hypothetical protein